jgi:hypothetical protein
VGGTQGQNLDTEWLCNTTLGGVATKWALPTHHDVADPRLPAGCMTMSQPVSVVATPRPPCDSICHSSVWVGVSGRLRPYTDDGLKAGVFPPRA